MGPRSTEFLREMGYCLRQATGEVKTSMYIRPATSLCGHTKRELYFRPGHYQPLRSF